MASSDTLTTTNDSQSQSVMMAWRVHQFGPPEVMSFEQMPKPTPGIDEVLVKVEAVGVGPWDAWIRAGKSALPQPLPLTPGSDLSGRVVAVGPNLSNIQLGDEIYGVTNPRFVGAYAEYALASAAMISTKPSSLTHIEAASVPVVAVTAWQALFDQAQLKAGQTVLIHGGAGNVGAYAVQLARRASMEIIATAATDDVSFVRNLGANTVIDFQTQPFDELVGDVDAVIDLVGGDTQEKSFKVIRAGGSLISTVSTPDQNLAARYNVRAAFFLVDVKSKYLAQIAEIIDGGKLQTHVGTVVPLDNARQAHLMLEGVLSRRKGKIVLSATAV